MKLKGLTLVFENCECITIDGENIGKLKLKDFFSEGYDKYHDDWPSISHNKGVKTVFIEILKDANVERAPFDEDLNTPYGQKNKHTVFKRIQDGDICWIDLDLELENGDEGELSTPSYFIHWTGKSDYKNKGQYCYLSKPGNLYVFITDKPFIKHRFKKLANMRYINNPQNYDKEYQAKRLAEIEREMKEAREREEKENEGN